mgnify:CR=1 FL=1
MTVQAANISKSDQIKLKYFLKFLSEYFKISNYLKIKNNQVYLSIHNGDSRSYLPSQLDITVDSEMPAKKFVNYYRFHKNTTLSRFVKKHFADENGGLFLLHEGVDIFNNFSDTKVFLKEENGQVFIRRSEELLKFLENTNLSNKIDENLVNKPDNKNNFKI